MKNELSISLGTLHTILGWPAPGAVTHPEGGGASIFASLAREKIGRALARYVDGRSALIGVLMGDSESGSTEPPIALVVDFQGYANENTLRELHRMAWNFSHTPTLITIEPGLLRAWSCCEAPNPDRKLSEFLVHEIKPGDLVGKKSDGLENRAARALHWINLVSGAFFSQYAERFDRDGRADQMLLRNLRDIRDKLRAAALQDDDVCHDLLARIIFVKFLFDRKDADGAAALTATKLTRLYAEGVLSQPYADFASILANYSDTYKLFDWLNTRFNGDLFPGKGDTSAARAKGWAREKRVVGKEHLALLSDFIRGDVDMPSGQSCLWPQYSFDVIPLEFISSIYETFVSDRAADGVFYTPPYLVDFVLDRVLPWSGHEWDLKILDPACGSGIFLVKAFQRLVHRWKQANPGQSIRAETLRNLLERNIFGVDKDPHAVRVACFSLYLAMCDEVEPRHYWTQIVFPTMREQRLVCSDFFAEDKGGFHTISDAGSYDLVVGNAPWGDSLVTNAAIGWASDDRHKWTVANKDIGGLFLAKAMHLLARHGRIAMIQSANSLLFNGSAKALAFRQELFTTHRVEEIYNLSALRFKVFKRKSHTTKMSISPACVVIMSGEKPTFEDQIAYVSPKHLKPLVDEFNIVIEPQDRRWLTVRDAILDRRVWTTLMWGGPRDRALIKKLQSFPSLAAPGDGHEVRSRQGIIYGDRTRAVPQLHTRRLFDSKTFPGGSLVYMDGDSLPKAGDIRTHSRDSTDFNAFSWPQLIIKQSWQKDSGRFAARLVKSKGRDGVLCNKSYVTVHADAPLLEAACVSFNSMVAVYFLQLTSGRVAAYRPEALVHELLEVPLPRPLEGLASDASTYGELDKRVFDAFGFKDAERALIEDMFHYTLADFRGDESSPGRQATSAASADGSESHLEAYCTYFARVLKSGFGNDKVINATIFQGEQDAPLPYRLVAFELGGDPRDTVKVVNMRTAALLKELERLDSSMPGAGLVRRGIYNERVARIYDSSGGQPTIFILKPDMVRYWTRSAALHDGDEVALDLFKWQRASSKRAAVQ
ncbi:HsdM family class I SAM-dependent methyltransferase [Burkholderia gladioli]|uniref:site-specific DNA-methyltransferase (adenine-specific) n=1 Tax=Burkholderia gladioli (strain BSR3) TaxID=999541 RepID=F2LTF8_BURGS|nr:N-6 DNA methylase [Burkholderia gladioli]AEA66104.1 type I restriction-modification system, M subunit, putative [Burkholderia gladioli BSR3]MBW5287603.1 N-6 DNA methylase [Burkholderia gladioli]